MPHNSVTFSDWGTMCHVSILGQTTLTPKGEHNSLIPQQQLELSTRSKSSRVPLNRSQFVSPSQRQANNLVAVCSIFERYNKALEDWLHWKQ